QGGVVGGLLGEVLELRSADRAELVATPAELASGDPQEQVAQLGDGLVATVAVGPQPLTPVAIFLLRGAVARIHDQVMVSGPPIISTRGVNAPLLYAAVRRGYSFFTDCPSPVLLMPRAYPSE